jgi:hypothetical protein
VNGDVRDCISSQYNIVQGAGAKAGEDGPDSTRRRGGAGDIQTKRDLDTARDRKMRIQAASSADEAVGLRRGEARQLTTKSQAGFVKGGSAVDADEGGVPRPGQSADSGA